jgi:hypothetical protein
MAGTKDERDVRRGERWLNHNVGYNQVSPETFGLLVHRLAARRQALLCFVPFVAAGAVIVATTTTAIEGAGNDHASWARLIAERALAAFAVVLIGWAVFDIVMIRAERGLAMPLPYRMSRATAVSLREMLGTSRTTFLIAALLADAGFAAVLLSLRANGLEWFYLGGFAVGCGFVAVGVWRAATRATVALDQVSLAIDERLRSSDAVLAVVPLYLLLLAFLPAALNVSDARSWLGPLWVVVAIVVSILYLWAANAGPGQTAWRMPSAAADTAPDGALQ